MTEDQAKKLIPPGYRFELSRGGRFYRATIYSEIGQPKGIGEAANTEEAIEKAIESFRQHQAYYSR